MKATIKQKARLALLVGVLTNTLGFAVIGYAAAEPLKVKPLPVIVSRVCTVPDTNGEIECTVTYENGATQMIKMKDGKIVEGGK